jgi:hypothetical protein
MSRRGHHEWIHILDRENIDGRSGAFLDCAEEYGFVGEPGPDGEDA